MQGACADVWVEEISLGRTRGARTLYDGIAGAGATWKWRLPLTVRGVRVVVRSRPPSSGSGSSSGREVKRRKQADVQRLLAGAAARVALGLLPFLGVHIKDVVIVHQVCNLKDAKPLAASRRKSSTGQWKGCKMAWSLLNICAVVVSRAGDH